VPDASAQPQITPDGEDRWIVTLAGTRAGTIQVHRRVRESFGVRSEVVEWSGRTDGGREVWGGGPPRDLQEAARWLAADLRTWLAAQRDHEHGRITLGRPRKDGSRLVKHGPGSIGSVRPHPRGWGAWTTPGTTSPAGFLREEGKPGPLAWGSAQEAAAALAQYRWQRAGAYWRGEQPPSAPVIHGDHAGSTG
jgi:hypothetical protein